MKIFMIIILALNMILLIAGAFYRSILDKETWGFIGWLSSVMNLIAIVVLLNKYYP